MSRDMVKAVVFDFGNVICRFDNDIFLRKLLPHTRTSFERMKELIYGSDLPRRYEMGRVTSEEFFREVVDRCALSISPDQLVAAFTGIFTPVPSTFGLIKRLKGRYRLGLLSNTNECHYERYFRQVEVFPLFDSVTLSFQVGEMKPGERIYRDALDKLQALPAECVFIDDIAEYAEGARRIGMRGIRYVSHDGLVTELRSHGVDP